MKTTHKYLAAATVMAGLVLSVLLPPPARVLAHGGEDHGDAAKPSAGVAMTDAVALPKESQFLFGVRTVLAAYSGTVTRATLYGVVLAVVTYLALLAYVEYPAGWLESRRKRPSSAPTSV